MQVHEKVGKSQNTIFFEWFCGSGGSKSRLSQAAGAEPSGQIRDEKLHALWREARFQVKTYKTPHAPTILKVQMSFWMAGARVSARGQKWAKGEGVVAVSTTTATALHSTMLHSTPLHSTTLHSTPLPYTTLTTTTASTTTTLVYTTLHYTRLHYITLPSIAFHSTQYTTASTTATTVHYTTTTTPLHYNYDYSFTTPLYIQQLWVRWPL